MNITNCDQCNDEVFDTDMDDGWSHNSTDGHNAFLCPGCVSMDMTPETSEGDMIPRLIIRDRKDRKTLLVALHTLSDQIFEVMTDRGFRADRAQFNLDIVKFIEYIVGLVQAIIDEEANSATTETEDNDI